MHKVHHNQLKVMNVEIKRIVNYTTVYYLQMDDDNMLDFSLWGDTPIIDMKSCILAEKSCVSLEPTKPTLESKFPPPKDFCQTF